MINIAIIIKNKETFTHLETLEILSNKNLIKIVAP